MSKVSGVYNCSAVVITFGDVKVSAKLKFQNFRSTD